LNAEITSSQRNASYKSHYKVIVDEITGHGHVLQNADVPYLLWLWTFTGSEANTMS